MSADILMMLGLIEAEPRMHRHADIALIAKQAAAEIVRLRGEVERRARRSGTSDMLDQRQHPAWEEPPTPTMPNGGEADWKCIISVLEHGVRDGIHGGYNASYIKQQIKALRAADNRDAAGVCSCPSGDGSLRWPCKAHPPESIAPAEAKGDDIEARARRMFEEANKGANSAPWERQWEPTRAYWRNMAVAAMNTPQPADGGAVAWRARGMGDDWVYAKSPFTHWFTRSPWEPLYSRQSTAQVNHPDDAAVDRFASAMKAKLADARTKGRGGWEDKYQCSQQRLSDLLRGHVEKGDPRDVANFCMMLWCRDEAITHPAGDALGAVRPLVDRWRGWIGQYDTGDEAIRDCIDELEAALQHRGDSQEVGRG